MSVEERKLMILQAYNNVLQQLATLKAKSDAAALYNAQMKISEQDFINGKIDITALSLERGRRSSAVITYQEGRAALHNAVTLLEMLTNVKIINRSSQENNEYHIIHNTFPLPDSISTDIWLRYCHGVGYLFFSLYT